MLYGRVLSVGRIPKRNLAVHHEIYGLYCGVAEHYLPTEVPIVKRNATKGRASTLQLRKSITSRLRVVAYCVRDMGMSA